MKHLLAAQFASAEPMLACARVLVKAGHRHVDLHSPYPIEGANEALALGPSWVRPVALGGGLFGAAGGYLLCWYLNAVQFPINVGGRPLHSAPAFIPVTFELGVLAAALSIVGALLALWRLPRLYHPVFDVPGFEGVSTSALWLSVLLEAERSELDELGEELRRSGALRVAIVPDRGERGGET